MSLADFIESDLPGLIDDWTHYALVLSTQESQLTETQLRNSAADILTAVVTDMRETQSAAEQETKSRGDKEVANSGFTRVARLHAEDRLSHGFSINDVVAEFRSLRATVLRRWQRRRPAVLRRSSK
ncbi:RsbRD N-terminal domain-containing protein [Paraburkholderia tropica]|uniref:RsbRD N-terminal domain-containing protein n=1 Tax=Paraburkholderia tropica TaxID=92647 RepID=UPI002AB0A853|nr:RsbRD N-terminal domain-containing protein [Paraburkholderia tropica]